MVSNVAEIRSLILWHDKRRQIEFRRQEQYNTSKVFVLSFTSSVVFGCHLIQRCVYFNRMYNDAMTFCEPQKQVIGNECIYIIVKLPHISKTLILGPDDIGLSTSMERRCTTL